MKLINTKILSILFFSLLFIISILTFKGYEVTGDEIIQRQHSIITMNFLCEKIEKTFHINTVKEKNNNINLENYSYKYYGVAMQIPLVFIEQCFSYNLSTATVFNIRHLYCFFIFFLSLIYFYRLISNYIVKNEKMALLAVAILVFSPRIYGSAFCGIKNSMFMSLTIINIFYCLKYLNNKNGLTLFLLCLTSAFAINLRVIAILNVFFVIIFSLFNKKTTKFILLKETIKIILFTYIIYVIITPASWSNPLIFPFEVVSFFFNYSDPVGHMEIQNLYFGKIISSKKLPWHYLPVWITITTPIIYIFFSLIGFITQVKRRKIKYNINIMYCNTILILILLFIMIVKPTMYLGWIHFLFLYPLIVINAIIGIKWLLNFEKLKKIIIFIIIINFEYVLIWSVKNYPYQNLYFDLFFNKYAIENFDT